jgi:hypothetical protein
MLAQPLQRTLLTDRTLEPVVIHQAADALVLPGGSLDAISNRLDHTLKGPQIAPDILRNPTLRRIMLRPGPIGLSLTGAGIHHSPKEGRGASELPRNAVNVRSH